MRTGGRPSWATSRGGLVPSPFAAVSLQFSPSLFTSLICQKSELLSLELIQNSLCGAPQGGISPWERIASCVMGSHMMPPWPSESKRYVGETRVPCSGIRNS